YFMRGEYERVLELDAEPYMRALALASLGRTPEAIAVIDAMDRSVTSRLTTYTIGLLQLLRGEHDESLATFRGLKRMQDPEGRYHVARHFAQLREAGEALEVLAAAVKDGFFCAPAMLRD